MSDDMFYARVCAERDQLRSDSRRLTWWFTEGNEREAARNRVRAKREKSKRYWSPMRWFWEIDKEMRKDAPHA